LQEGNLKRLNLTLAIIVYLISIFAEAWIFKVLNSHSENHSVLTISNDVDLVDPSNADIQSVLNHECAEMACHVGHCHHLSTAASQDTSGFLYLNSLHSDCYGLGYSFTYPDSLKRPPKSV
jgi:hypothetical protein